MSYPCPLDHCSIPMYDSEWHKNRNCQLWQLDDEERFDYYDHIEDAKSAKYKAKIEFYKQQDQDEQAANKIQNTIEHGRFFFYDTIIPMNENLKIDPTQFDESDIFPDDEYEYEEFDEDYIGFSSTEEINSSLCSASIISKSLKFFQQQAENYVPNKVAKHFFFDSQDDEDNKLLVELFQELESVPKPPKSQPPGIIEIINNKLNQQQRNEAFEQAANQLKQEIKQQTTNNIYNQLIVEFLESYPDNIKPKQWYLDHETDYESNNYIEELFEFEKLQYQLKVPYSKLKFKIVYLTSGGGKTTLSKQHHLYLDIDAFIARHYSKFKLVDKFCTKYNNYSMMSLFFKHTFWKDIDFLQGKIILCNHPNQLPNQFRLGFNEMILIPQQQNWDVRWFNENYYSLLAVKGKIMYLSDYDNYGKIIFNHFTKFKRKDFTM